MIVTESALREQLRRPHRGAGVRVPHGATLSPSAEDFVRSWGLVVTEETGAGAHTGTGAHDRPWDTPSVFPVVLTGEVPRCGACGEPVRDKPDVLTQLNATTFVPKTDPRIRLRGRVDSLQALALLVAARAGAAGQDPLAADLGTVAAYCRELMSAEYNERDAAAPALGALGPEDIHAATHDPAGRMGVEHLTPGTSDPELMHWLNWLRCQVREAEVLALTALAGAGPWSASIVHGLNRLSSLVYYLELRLMRGTP